jgi:hypothetical protein
MSEVCRMLDYLVGKGNLTEQDLAAHLLHEVSDYMGRYDKREGLIKESQVTQSAISK